MPVSFADGSPAFVASAAFLAAAIDSAIRERGTSMRVGALHDCPVLRKHSCVPCFTAFSKSASSKIMFADFPPSSWVTRFTEGAAADATAIPARVEPVKETMATSGCDEIAAPTVAPSQFDKLKTPARTQDSCKIWANT